MPAVGIGFSKISRNDKGSQEMTKHTLFILCQICLSFIGWSQCDAFAAPPAPEWVLLMSGNQGDLLCNKAGIQDDGSSFKRILCKTNIDDSNRAMLKYIDSAIDFSSAYVSYSEVEFNCQELKYHLIQDSVFGRPNRLLYKSTKQYPVGQEYEGSTMYNVLKRMCELSGQPLGVAHTESQTSGDDPLAKALADAKKKANRVSPSKIESTKMQTKREVFKKKCCTNYDDIHNIFIDFSRFEHLPKKDEFETTVQYNKKIEDLRNEAKKIEDRCYLFLLDTKGGWSRYNADDGTMAFGINYPGAILLKTDVSGSDYIGESPLGLTKNIKKIIETKYSVSFTNIESTSYTKTDKYNGYIPIGSVSIETEKAKELKNRYAVAILAKPEKTYSDDGKQIYFKHDYYKISPTIQSPYDTQFLSEQFSSKLLAAIVIDTSSGKVLKYKSFDGDTGCISNYEIK